MVANPLIAPIVSDHVDGSSDQIAGIKRFVTTARRYRTIQIQAGEHTITAADPLPDELHAALNAIHGTH